jgi:acetyl-CoA C-acetyltransferase
MSTSKNSVVIVDALRSPVGRRGGGLSTLHPAETLGRVQRALIDRTGIDPASVDSVLAGNMAPGGFDQFYVARHIGLYSGVPLEVPALGVQRICGTGFELFRQAGEQITCGAATLALVVGTESMTRNPIAAFDHRGGDWFDLDPDERFDIIVANDLFPLIDSWGAPFDYPERFDHQGTLDA